MKNNELTAMLIKLNGTFQYLRIAHYLDLGKEYDLFKADNNLLSQIEQFYIKYHSMMSRFPRLNDWNYNQLYANTGEFRSLTDHQRNFFLNEDKRINSLFSESIDNAQNKIYLCMYYANYWMALLDGFRVSYWLYRALETSKLDKELPEETGKMHLRLKELVLSTLDMAPYQKNTEGSSQSILYFDFDAVTKYIIDRYGASIDEHCQTFSPRISVVFK